MTTASFSVFTIHQSMSGNQLTALLCSGFSNELAFPKPIF